MKKEIIQKYEALLASIAPEVLAEKISLKHQWAFQNNTFPEDIKTSSEFYHALGVFYQNQCRAIGKGAPLLDECIEEARQYLGEHEADAWKQSHENLEEGFLGICQRIADGLKREEELAFIRAAVRDVINIFSYEEKEAFALYYCQARLPYYSPLEKRLAVIKIANDLDKFAEIFTQEMNKRRHP